MKGMNFDLHVHTNISSCSKLEIGDILRYARAFGLDGVCITDHQTMEIRHHLREGIQEDGLCVIFGMEYSTQDGDFLIFGPFEDIPPTLSAEDMLALVDKCGGLAIAAHPFRSNRPVGEHIIRQGRCRAIESINGRNTRLENLRAQRWYQKYELTQTGGSDAHTLEELGGVCTRFDIPVRFRSDLIFALKKGLCRPERDNTSADRILHQAASA